MHDAAAAHLHTSVHENSVFQRNIGLSFLMMESLGSAPDG